MSDWAAIALQVATELLGEPNQRLSSQDELRWGNPRIIRTEALNRPLAGF